MSLNLGATAVYRRANLDWVSDPLTIAHCLGLLFAPLRDRSLTHRLEPDGAETWLFYRQEDHGDGNYVGRRTGLNVFRGLAEYCGCDVGELVLPRDCIRLMPLHAVLDTQVFAPKNFLVDRYTKTNGSGAIVHRRR